MTTSTSGLGEIVGVGCNEIFLSESWDSEAGGNIAMIMGEEAVFLNRSKALELISLLVKGVSNMEEE